jgi:hypothetical protein
MPGPPAVNVSISILTTLLAQRLGINLAGAPNFWGTAELDLYVRQAIREFQVLTAYWRDRPQLVTATNVPFYDLHALGVIPYTVNDTDILKQVGYHLLEFDGSQSTPINTTQFSLTALTSALDQRREEILGETRLVVQEYAGNAPGPPPGSSRLQLSSGVIQIHRVDWFDTPGNAWHLVNRADEIGGYGWIYQWAQNPADPPRGYSVTLTRPFELAFIPAPSNTGKVSLLITACNPYAYTGSPQLIDIPDDAAYCLPWGILASVLNQDAQSRDYRRATYAAKRFRQALVLLKSWPCVMNSYPGGLEYPPSTLFALDHWLLGWRNQTPAQPSVVAVAGRNLLALSPVPDAAYNIALDCVVNSPASIATRTQDFDMAGDIVTAVLNNAYHLACFKLQGAEFEATMDDYRDFLLVAQANASRERAQSINFEALRGVTNEEDADVPYDKGVKDEEEVEA